ncbi:MAG: hypothetical protein Q7J34_00835 [Bacteroidales bacterium]|nr:hypothetical protein [Bacteroidales bacterium]
MKTTINTDRKQYLIIRLAIILVFSCFSVLLNAQSNKDSHSLGLSIPEIALLDIEPSGGNSVTMAFPFNGIDAGQSIIQSVDNSDSWINITSIVQATKTRKVTVEMNGDLPDGTFLKVSAKDYSGKGEGTHGQVISQIILSNEPQDLIANIGSCYTGNGIGNGYNLHYSWQQNSIQYNQLKDQTSYVSVIYTLVQNE